MRLVIAVFLLAFAALGAPLSLAAEEQPADTQSTDEPSSFDRFGLEEPDGEALATFLIGQTAHGALLGLQSCALTDSCGDSERGRATSALAGSGVGLGASFLYSRRTDITPGRAAAKNYGTLFGGLSGLLTTIALDDELNGDGTTALVAMMSGQLTGLTAGHYLGRSFDATAGDVRLLEAGAGWTTFFYSGLQLNILDRDPSSREMALSYLGTLSVGTVGGGLLASHRPMTAERVRLINLGGALGGLLGFTAGRYARGEDATRRQRSRAQWSGATAGAVVGLGTAFAITTNFDDPDLFQTSSTSASLSVAPADADGGFLASLQGSF